MRRARPSCQNEGPPPDEPATGYGRKGEPTVLTLLFVFTAVAALTGWLVSLELRRERARAGTDA